jgi:Fe2+ or Zn2+ uptake regulation protein
VRSSSVTLAILDVLENSDDHLTAAEVYERIHHRLSALNPSTVYRALDRLVGSGMISRSDIGTGSEVYERVENLLHHHLVCQRCGGMTTLDHAQIGLLFTAIEEKTGFTPCTNHLVLFGICPDCK